MSEENKKKEFRIGPLNTRGKVLTATARTIRALTRKLITSEEARALFQGLNLARQTVEDSDAAELAKRVFELEVAAGIKQPKADRRKTKDAPLLPAAIPAETKDTVQ